MEQKRISVLLIEDNMADARLVQEMLSESVNFAFDFNHVENISKAHTHIKKNRYDVILLDLSLPDSFGLDTVQSLVTANPDLPIVVLSGTGDEKVAMDAVQNGAQDYLVKGQGASALLSRSLRYAIERKRTEQKMSYLAQYDVLTNLPNRTLFSLRLNQAINIAKRNNKKLALLFMDLDNFKVINDTQGHEVGDQVLKVAAKTMKDCVRETDTLARLGGDEFVLLVDDVDDEVELRHVADKFLSAFEFPIEISGRIYTLTTSIGISVYPNDGESADMLLQTSDTAMYEAKARGRNAYVYYKPELTTLVHERVKLESELRTAIINEDLVVYYQPIYSMGENEIVAVEALVRWQHAEKGLIPPDDFIYLAEETGLINELGKYVVKTASQQCMKWWLDGLKEFTLSVNISAKQLEVGYSNVLIEALKELNFPFRKIELEVTESLVMPSNKTVLAELETIREVGINISMDDFGIGYSSLSQLKTLPISKLKIDKSFVMNIPNDRDDMVIAKTIIAMGHSLGLVVVAEGVETEEQKQFLQSEKCDLLQGYYFSRPMPADELEKMLREL